MSEHQDPVVHAVRALPGAGGEAGQTMAVAWLVIAVVLQYALIYHYVARIGGRFASMYVAGGWRRLVVHLLKAPATALHELAHYAMCLATGTPTGKIVLWRPQSRADGAVVFGYVEYAPQGAFTSALCALAPGILIPPLLALYGFALTGAALPSLHRLSAIEPWQVAAWIIGLAIFTSSAFPSFGDFELLHVGHWLAVAFALAAGVLLVVTASGETGLIELLARLVALLLPATIVAGAFAIARTQAPRRL